MLFRTRLAALTFWVVGVAIATIAVFAADLAAGPDKNRWEVSDFDPVIAVGLEGYRDFENGRRHFTEATCAKCHRFAGAGPVGANTPDLEKAAKMHNPRELLEGIIAPDKVIAPGEVVRIFELTDGRLVEGRVLEEAGNHFLVNPDPRTPDRIVKVLATDVVNRRISPTSAMPSGLLDPFEEEDVLDLLAYLLSGGDEKDPLFSR